jgi:hypothetical protein
VQAWPLLEFHYIKNGGSWWRVCAGKGKAPLSLKECRAWAKAKGGHCLSTKYENNNTNMEWECKMGHRWSANIKKWRDLVPNLCSQAS